MTNISSSDMKQLIEVCHSLHARGMVSGSGGNVSIRVGDKILITPTGVSLSAISEENLVVMNMDGTWEGEIRPSKEYVLHQSCYQNRPDVKAVVHVHSLHAVALSCLIEPGDEIPIYFSGYAMRVGRLPMLPYMKPGAKELASGVAEVIKERNSVLLANHGVVCVGADIQEAVNIAEEIEENAHLYFVLQGGGHPLQGKDLAAFSL